MIKTTLKPNQNQNSLKKWSYQHNLSEYPFQGLTAGQLLNNAASKYPDRMAVISAYQSKRITFAQLLYKADRFAAGLMSMGIKKGDHVAIWSHNSIEWVVVSLACARAGFVLAQLNHSYKSNELLYSVNKVKVKVLVCGCDSTKQDYYGILKQIDEGMFEARNGSKSKTCHSYYNETEGQETLVKVRSERFQSLQIVVSLSDNQGTISYDDVFTRATDEFLMFIKSNQDQIDIDDPLNIQFTSGSTGNAKAALLSHHNVINNSYFIGKRFQMDEKHHSICVNVPFFHTYGTTAAIFSALHFGTTLVLPYDFYDPEKSLKAISEYNCSIIYGTPTMYVDLMAQQRILNLNINPDILCTGGAQSTPQLINDIYEQLRPKFIVNIYGMTEGTAVFYQSYLNSDKNKVLQGLGYLGDHIEAKVVNKNGNIVPIGTPGELCVRGYNTMIGYYNDDVLTSKTFVNNRWLKTGDKFLMFEDGSGQAIGRIKDIIIRGGENIDPKEIEDCIATYPSVLECHVVGLPNVRLGEEICACVRVKLESNVSLSDIQLHCKQKLAHYKIPSQMYVFEEYPKTTSGKIQKFKIVEYLTQKLVN